MAFSRKRAFGHAMVAVVALVVVGCIVAAAGFVKDAAKFGEGMTKFALFFGAIVFGISYLAQTGRRRTAIVTGVGLGVAITGMLVAIVVVGSRAPVERLVPEERVPLTVVDGRLVHPFLGYSVRHPGAEWEPAPTALVEASFSKDLDIQAYAYAERQGGGVLAIVETSDAPTSQRGFDEMIAGMRRGMDPGAKTLSGGEPLRTVTEEASWHDGAGESHQHFVAGAVHVRLDVYCRVLRGRPRVVVVMTVTRGGDTLADVGGSFRAGS